MLLFSSNSLKIFLLSVLFYSSASPAWAAISFVTAGSSNTYANGDHVSLTLTAGDLLVVLASSTVPSSSNCNSSNVSVSDTQNDSFIQVGSFVATNYLCSGMWYANNITGGPTTISVTQPSEDALVVFEFSGQATSSVLDVNGATASGVSPSSLTPSSFSTTNANEMVVAGLSSYDDMGSFSSATTNSVSMTVPANGLISGAHPPPSVGMAYLAETSTLSGVTTSIAPDYTSGTGDPIQMIVGSFKATSTTTYSSIGGHSTIGGTSTIN